MPHRVPMQEAADGIFTLLEASKAAPDGGCRSKATVKTP
jgi:hypothetical protein